MLLPGAAGLVLLLASHSAQGLLSANSRGWANTTGPVRSWIDDRIGSSAGRASYLYVPNPTSFASSTVLVNTQFWNRSIGPVYTLDSTELCPLPLGVLHIDDRTGDLRHRRTSTLRYLITDHGIAVAAKVVASGGPTVQPLTIYRPTLPLRLASREEGVYSDGSTGPDASYSQYWLPQSRPGTVEVTLSRVAWTGPDVPGMVTVTVGRLGARSGTPPTGRGRWLAHRGESTVLRLRTPEASLSGFRARCTDLLARQLGSSDNRQLGVQFGVALAKAG